MEDKLSKESIWSISYIKTICPECYYEHIWCWDGSNMLKIVCANCDYELSNHFKGKEKPNGG